MTWPDRISVYHKLRCAPADSTDAFVLDVVILSEKHRRAAARCVEDIVLYDYRKAAKTTLPPFMVNAFRNTFLVQEAAKRQNRGKVRELLDRIDDLEKQTWNRIGAVEDMGSGKR